MFVFSIVRGHKSVIYKLGIRHRLNWIWLLCFINRNFCCKSWVVISKSFKRQCYHYILLSINNHKNILQPKSTAKFLSHAPILFSQNRPTRVRCVYNKHRTDNSRVARINYVLNKKLLFSNDIYYYCTSSWEVSSQKSTRVQLVLTPHFNFQTPKSVH